MWTAVHILFNSAHERKLARVARNWHAASAFCAAFCWFGRLQAADIVRSPFIDMEGVTGSIPVAPTIKIIAHGDERRVRLWHG
jgi:hypothetical protein